MSFILKNDLCDCKTTTNHVRKFSTMISSTDCILLKNNPDERKRQMEFIGKIENQISNKAACNNIASDYFRQVNAGTVFSLIIDTFPNYCLFSNICI